MTENKLCAVEAVKELLLSQNNILLVSHRNPDGDTLGSNAALCSALRRAGKTAYLFPNPQVTDKFFPFISEFFAPDGFVPDFTVAVDVPAPDMLSNGFTGKPDLCIDHHPTNPCYGETANLIQPEKAACGEIILSLIEAMHGTATPREADLLYIAVSTDTGCFQYANTGSDTFLSAARIVSYGASNADLNVIFFRKVSKARLKLEGMIYSGMYFYRNGEVVVSTVTLDMMEKCGATEDDCDDLAALPGRIDGEKIGITIREISSNKCKISVRTTKDISASEICSRFGGGGHAMASGCSIDAGPDEARELLLKAVDEVTP